MDSVYDKGERATVNRHFGASYDRQLDWPKDAERRAPNATQT